MAQNLLTTPYLLSHRVLPAALMVIAICLPAVAQRTPASTGNQTRAEDPLDQYNASVEELVKKVWPSVVQIQVTSYGPREEISR